VGEVVSGSPAEQAGLQPGDVIRQFDGHEVQNLRTLRTLVAQAPLDKQVDLQIVRNGKPLTVKTQIKEQPVDYETRAFYPAEISRSPQGRNSLTTKKQLIVHWPQFTWTN